MRNDVSRDMTTVAVHDKETTCLWILRPCFWLEDGRQPFVRMAIRSPAAVTRRETPVAGRVSWYLGRVGMLCLEDDQRRDCSTGSTHALDSSYPLLPSRDHLPTRLLPYANQCS